MSTNIRVWYDAVLQQMAAEAYPDQSDLFGGANPAIDVLMFGSNNPTYQQQQGNAPTTEVLRGTTRMTATQAEEFLSRYEIVSHLPNTASGFSGTLIREIATGAYTLAFRSTEFLPAAVGGDRERDFGTNVEIGFQGFAFGQIASMESYYEHLIAGESYNAVSGQWEIDPALDDFSLRFGIGNVGGTLNVSGYSLSGNLANVFTALHPEVDHAYLFNATGLGSIGQGDLATMVDDLRARLANTAVNVSDPGATSIYDPILQPGIYAQYQSIVSAMHLIYETSYATEVGPPNNKITQLFGEAAHNDFQVVANSGLHVPATKMFIEDQPEAQNWILVGDDGDFGKTHSITLLVDSLAVMSVFERLGLDMSTQQGLDTAYSILSAGTAERGITIIGEDGVAERDSLEAIVTGLYKLLTGSDVTLISDGGLRGFSNISNRDEFYKALDVVNAEVAFQPALEFESLVDKTANDLILAATNPDPSNTSTMAYRYALKALNPFAVSGVDYSQHNTSGALDLYVADAGARSGSLTQRWIEHRAAFLAWANITNRDDDTSLVSTDVFGDRWFYTDLPKDYTVRLVGELEQVLPDAVLDTLDHHRVIFGGDAAAGLIGANLSDKLYGGLGTNYLVGNRGDDHLEAGAGLDVYQYGSIKEVLEDELGNEYVFHFNDGADTVLDTDGAGLLRYTFKDATGLQDQTNLIVDASIKLSDSQWQSADELFTYTKTGANLRIDINDGSEGSLLIEDFRDGDFFIRFGGEISLDNLLLIEGDLAPVDGNPSTAEIDLTFDALGNVITAGPEPGRADILKGSDGVDGHDRIVAGGGRDQVIAKGGDDVVESGSGGTLGGGEFGGDLVDGGDGNDWLYADLRVDVGEAIVAGRTATPTGLKGDLLSGRAGDDVIVGGADNDLLVGGTGGDILIGGAGDDNLGGGADWQPIIFTWSYFQDGVFRQFGGISGTDHPVDDGGDTIYAGTGDDYAWGGYGDDVIFGEAGNDTLLGQWGSDILVGGAGNDKLYGESSRTDENDSPDILDGGEGDDLLVGRGGDDILIGGPGNDDLQGGAGRDIYIFNRGDGVETISDLPDDALDAAERSVIILGDGINRNDVTFTTGSMVIDFGPSDPDDPNSPHDQIRFPDFDHSNPYATPVLGELRFADGSVMSYDDILEQGFDIDGTEDHDGVQFFGAPGVVRASLYGTAVVDRIRGFEGNDHLVGFDGDDVLDGGPGFDFLYGGDGDDWLIGGPGDDQVLAGENGNDLIEGGDGSDALIGGDGDDVLDGGAGADRLLGNAGVDLLDGGDGNDQLHGGVGNDILDGGTGADRLFGGDGNDSLDGDAGNDILSAGWGDDTLLGGDGDDVLEANVGDDVLDGGAGADILAGNHGNDRYLIDPSATGVDVIDEVSMLVKLATDVSTYAGWSESTDSVEFGAGVTPDDLVVSVGEYSAVDVGGNVRQFETTDIYWGGDRGVRVLLADENNPWVSRALALSPGASYGIESYAFADGSVLTHDEIAAMTGIAGTEADDYLVGLYEIGDRLFGFGGDDVLVGLSGDDYLAGGAGNDELVGGQGSDIYQYRPGDGNDRVAEYYSNEPGALNILQLSGGIDAATIEISQQGRDVVLQLPDGSGSVTVADWAFGPDRGVQQVVFDDGTAWTWTEIEARLIREVGTSGDDTLFATEGDESILALEGNDTIFDYGGSDFFDAGDGNDIVYANPTGAADWAIGGDGDDRLGTVSMDVFVGGVAALYGGNGSDDIFTFSIYSSGTEFPVSNGFIAGGAGDDFLGGGNSVVAINRGDGHDVVWVGYTDLFFEGPTTLSFRESDVRDMQLEVNGFDVNLRIDTDNSIWLSRDFEGQELIGLRLQSIGDDVSIYDLTGIVTHFEAMVVADPSIQSLPLDTLLDDYFVSVSADSAFGGDLAVAYARFGDGAKLTASMVNAVLTAPEFGISAQYTPLLASPGGAGLGTAGADTMLSGPGNDLLLGGAGADTYRYEIGGGVDSISDASLPGEQNTLVFGASISAAAISLRLGSLVIGISENDEIHLLSFDAQDPFGTRDIDTFVFADGTSLTYEQLLARGFDLIGTAEPEVVAGTAVTDRIRGEGGNDLLLGGSGEDTYFYAPGDGFDTVRDAGLSGEVDTISFDAGVAPGDLQFGLRGTDLILNVAGGALTIEQWSDPSFAIEQLRFADGTLWDAATLLAQVEAQAIQLALLADQIAIEDVDFGYALPAQILDTTADPASAILTATLAGGGALPEWLHFDPVVGAFSGTAANADVGEIQVAVSVSDTSGGNTQSQFVLSVVNVNDAPQGPAGVLPLEAIEDLPFEFDLASVFVDEDAGDTLLFFAEQIDGSLLPEWLSLDATSGILSGAPANDDVGSITLALEATDSEGLTAQGIAKLKVINTNDAPLLAYALPDVETLEDEQLAFWIAGDAFTDVDAGDVLTYSVHLADGGALPAWLGFDSQARRFSGMPENADVGIVSVEVTATDEDGASASDGFDINVLNVNDAPQVGAALPEVEIVEARSYVLALPADAFIDIDLGDSLALSARLVNGDALPQWLTFDGAAGLFTAMPGDDAQGVISVSVSATDIAGESASSEFKVDVINVNTVYGTDDPDILILGNDNDIVFAGNSGDTVYSGARDDVVYGENGDDYIDGESGNDWLDGGRGNDNLYGGDGNDAFIGNRGDDLIVDPLGHSFAAGGMGADVLSFSGAASIVAMNGREAIDHVENFGSGTTLSLGSGIVLDALSLQRTGDDLMLVTGNNAGLLLSGWYEKGQREGMKLQLIESDSGAVGDPVQVFDFASLVAGFDQAQEDGLPFDVASALPEHLQWTSDSHAIGGELAYRYATAGTLSDLTPEQVQMILGEPDFATEGQAFVPQLSTFVESSSAETTLVSPQVHTTSTTASVALQTNPTETSIAKAPDLGHQPQREHDAAEPNVGADTITQIRDSIAAHWLATEGSAEPAPVTTRTIDDALRMQRQWAALHRWLDSDMPPTVEVGAPGRFAPARIDAGLLNARGGDVGQRVAANSSAAAHGLKPLDGLSDGFKILG